MAGSAASIKVVSTPPPRLCCGLNANSQLYQEDDAVRKNNLQWGKKQHKGLWGHGAERVEAVLIALKDLYGEVPLSNGS